MALLDLGVDKVVDAFIWFQDYKGQIRSSELKGNAWRQGQSSDIVMASNVKNGTPITAVSYTKDTALTVGKSYRDHFLNVFVTKNVALVGTSLLH